MLVVVNVFTTMFAAFLLLMGPKPTRPFCSLRKFHHNHLYAISTSSNTVMSGDSNHEQHEDYNEYLTTTTEEDTYSNSAMSQEQNHNVFPGHNTKMGKRRLKREDKATNNARVRNSYLKLTLNESVFYSLHELACQTKRQWDCSDQRQDLKIISKKQSKRQLTIKPRTLSSLHMTYFFCGKVLEEMPCDELSLWNAMVRQRLSEHISDSSSVGEYTLRFKGLKLFPPNRNSLLVAMFESSPKLLGLYEELCNLAMTEKPTYHDNDDGDESTYLFPLLADLTKSQDDKRNQNNNSSPSWVAHVTLGNLAGGSRDDVKRLNSWLGDYNYQECDMLQMTNEIKVHGLALGGPVPSHVDVDWEFVPVSSGRIMFGVRRTRLY